MPQKNTLKVYSPHTYYHVYSRGVNKQKIFMDASDQKYFILLFERYLSDKKATSKVGVVYPNHSKSIQLFTYCLMTNHIHLLLYQLEDPTAIRKFMSSLLTSYSKYFNYKYRRVGAVFESRYKAKSIDSDNYLIHISRYIHMNPRSWRTYHYSSLIYAFNDPSPSWLHVNKVTEEFQSKEEYLEFLTDYQQAKDMLEDVKHQLANE